MRSRFDRTGGVVNGARAGRVALVFGRSRRRAWKAVRGEEESGPLVVAQVPAVSGMAQLAQGLGFDLPDALPSDPQHVGDLLKSVRLSIDQAISPPDDLGLTGFEDLLKQIIQFIAQHVLR